MESTQALQLLLSNPQQPTAALNSHLLSTWAATLFGWLNGMINLVVSVPRPYLFSLMLFGTLVLLVGWRLFRYSHPDRPYIGNIIRALVAPALLFVGAVIHVGQLLILLAMVLLVVLTAAIVSGEHQEATWTFVQLYVLQIWPIVQWPSIAVIAGALSGMVIGGLIVLGVIPYFERGEGLSDIRHMRALFLRMKTYDPLKHIDVTKGVFVGLENGKHSVRIPFRVLRETHLHILGASGGGKGITLGLLGYQFIKAGESTIVFDPKGDDRLPSILSQAANQMGVGFQVLDLGPNTSPQFNLLEHASSSEIEELLVAGLRLQPTAGDGDYYRGIDQDACEKIANLGALKSNPSLPDLLAMAQLDELFVEADNFKRRLRQVSELPAIQTKHGIDIAAMIDRGDVLYVRGSTDNHRVKVLQTMLLVRILQIIKGRGDPSSRPKVALILDEFKHVLSSVSLDMLGVVRSFGCHAVIAHQSMGDLGSVPSMRREDVEPVISDNTTLKLVFRISDPDTASYFSALSGQQRTHTEAARGVDENGRDQRMWSEMHQPRMSEDLFTHLHRPSDGISPVAAAVLFGLGTAKLIAVAPIYVERGTAPSFIPAPADSVCKPLAPESLI